MADATYDLHTLYIHIYTYQKAQSSTVYTDGADKTSPEKGITRGSWNSWYLCDDYRKSIYDRWGCEFEEDSSAAGNIVCGGSDHIRHNSTRDDPTYIQSVHPMLSNA